VASDPASAIGAPGIDAILIGSSTDTHLDLIDLAIAARKPVFCEKPLHLDLRRVDECVSSIQASGVPVFVGFNRRFDPSHRAVHDGVRDGDIGKVEMVVITSRDPAPPGADYIKVSGGIFRDMLIHDFDMARWLLGEEPIEVYATGSCLVDPEIAKLGDLDTTMVVLRTESGALCHINTSRRATYGYDQRAEVFGSEGMLRSRNERLTKVERSGVDGTRQDPLLHFFPERYRDAYRLELDHFVRAIESGEPLLVTERDGRQALALADAALESSKTGQPVAVDVK